MILTTEECQTLLVVFDDYSSLDAAARKGRLAETNALLVKIRRNLDMENYARTGGHASGKTVNLDPYVSPGPSDNANASLGEREKRWYRERYGPSAPHTFLFTVVGYMFPEKTRYATHVEATSPTHAEDQVIEKNPFVTVVSVFSGWIDAVDDETYTRGADGAKP